MMSSKAHLLVDCVTDMGQTHHDIYTQSTHCIDLCHTNSASSHNSNHC